MSLFKKKKVLTPLLTEEDTKELKEIERKNYMDSARKLMEERGKQRAKNDLEIKKKDKC